MKLQPGNREGTNPPTPEPPPPLHDIGLGGWSLYFLIKFFLYWRDYIAFHALENLAFGAFLLLPVESRFGRLLRNTVAVFTGIVLFYHDTWLPSPKRLFSQLDNLTSFSGQYLLELAMRFMDLRLLSVMVLLWVGYLLASRYIRVGFLVMLTLATLAFLYSDEEGGLPGASFPSGTLVTEARGTLETETPAAPSSPSPEDLQNRLDRELENFHQTERQRVVPFPANEQPEFDLLFIHVCSLSWDDLEWAGLKEHPLLASFDILFTNFNSAASYSGPAAIRVLRANCGQPSHHDLYQDASTSCYLFENLKKAGFDMSLYLNHDGRFGDFLKTPVQKRGGWHADPKPLEEVTVQQHAFDGTPIHDDLAVLSHWLDKRRGDGTPDATYYNTISLHDGNRLIGKGADLDSRENYSLRLHRLLDNLLAFFRMLENSGRKAVVVLVPEHGAAVRGDRIQIAGLREIPSPAITRVPVGIRVFGPNIRHGVPQRINRPVSYLAISHVVRELLEDNPFRKGELDLEKLTRDLPQTRFVSENEDIVVMQYNNRYYLRLEDGQWTPY